MIFEIFFIISYTLLYPYTVHAIQCYLNNPATNDFFGYPEFEMSNLWDFPIQEEYIQHVLDNLC